MSETGVKKSKAFLMFKHGGARKGESWYLYATPHMLFRGETVTTRGVRIDHVLIRGVTYTLDKLRPFPTLTPGDQIALRVTAVQDGDIWIKLHGATVGDPGAAVPIDVTTYADRLVQTAASCAEADDEAMIWRRGGVSFIEHEGGFLVVVQTVNGNWSTPVAAEDVSDALLALAQRNTTAAVAIAAWVQKKLGEHV